MQKPYRDIRGMYKVKGGLSICGLYNGVIRGFRSRFAGVLRCRECRACRPYSEESNAKDHLK